MGGYGNLLTLDTLNPGEQWSLSAPTNTDIEYALIGDSISIRGPPLATLHSDSLGNNTNWNIDPYWVGAGPDANWSDGLNWDSGTAPIATSIVTFDGTSHGVSNANPNKDATVDQNFTIEPLTINGYTGTTSFAMALASFISSLRSFAFSATACTGSDAGTGDLATSRIPPRGPP